MLNKDFVYQLKESLTDVTKDELIWVNTGKKENITADIIKELKRRKLVEEKQKTFYEIRKGKSYKNKRETIKTELTSAMLANGGWKNE
jgi:hypothetical protein